MEYRKLISFGKSSYVVSLPKEWVRKLKLKKGDLIYFDENAEDLVISACDHDKEKKETEIVIDVDKKELKQIKREIISAYIKDNKTIVLSGNEIKDKAKDIQPIIQSFVALEVMEQTSKKIIAKDFLNIDDVSTKTIVRKIDVIIRSMLEDCEKTFEEDSYESISHRDQDVNKLTFLIFRIVRYGMDNLSYIIKKFNLTATDLLHLWLLSYYLESVADEVKRISRYLKRVNLSRSSQQEYLELFRNIKEAYLKLIKAYYDNDIPAAHQIVNERENLIARCEAFYNKNKNLEGIGLLTERTKAAVVHINHIGRVIYQ